MCIALAGLPGPGKKVKPYPLACEKYVFHLEALEDMLGYKLPVIWPEDDWFVEVKVDPAYSDGQSKRAQFRKNPKPQLQKRTRRHEIINKPPRDTFPGSFFGFGPAEETVPEPAENKEKKVVKKKRPRRYRKKQTPAKNDVPNNSNTESTT